MLCELIDFILSQDWEWQPRKSDHVDSFFAWLCWCLFMCLSGSISGLVVCFVFDIGVVGELWRSGQLR